MEIYPPPPKKKRVFWFFMITDRMFVYFCNVFIFLSYYTDLSLEQKQLTIVTHHLRKNIYFFESTSRRLNLIYFNVLYSLLPCSTNENQLGEVE